MQTLEQNSVNYQILNKCPAVFSNAPHSEMSGKYKLLSSIDFVHAMDLIGFVPVSVSARKTRDFERALTQKHVIRFRKAEETIYRQGVTPEILFQNAHDGSSSYRVTAGVFRYMCSNGLVVGDIAFERRILHKGNAMEEVMGSVKEIIEVLPKAVTRVDEWSKVDLNQGQKLEFATKAALVKWEELDKIPVSAEELLNPVREADKGSDLWSVFNVLQEKVIRGGVEYVRANGRHARTRPITHVRRNVEMNKQLWNIAESFAR